MKAKITNTCICCGTCAGICPVGAISRSTSGDRYEVDPTKCIACGSCINVCPVEAIVENHSDEKENQ